MRQMVHNPNITTTGSPGEAGESDHANVVWLSALVRPFKTVELSHVAPMSLSVEKTRSGLRSLQRLPVILDRLKRQRYLRISVAKVSRETITMTVTFLRRTLDYADTGESGESYDHEQSSSNSNPL
jgi:hypothetical protein